ncbi:acetate kinase [Anaerobranca californiensis DSM 14826]|jgi:acetate kinase|uniref:Acetate kinase n=1 Tax=Anaerobranca californiensis DSM 14826 TaxID=1120989 RepID=A0A1M6KNM8_9FIRM|nr:acetate kinase [Anaerobranca californiensis]SHJ60486.1 acetate kinase [Anaerobranca californiensis DSM 14826]
MKILVVNCGSSSLKYQLFDMNGEQVLAKGIVERIGIDGVLVHQKGEGDKVKLPNDIPNHKVAIELVINTLTDKELGVLQDITEIEAVGHRVVHGGEAFSQSVLIDDSVMDTLNKCIELAPLHNPPNIMGIEACAQVLPGVKQVAVFDTAFHQTMPKKSFIYSLPYEAYEKYSIRRYGFHGTSHKYVAQQAAKLLGKDLKDLKLITCHLGNGASVTAIDGGKSVDTSMGFTPLEGLTMGTRCGDIDPAIVIYLMKKMNLDFDGMNDYLNKKSGVLGISGVSSDFRDIEIAAAEGNERAQLALDVFVHKVKKYIGAYTAVLGGVDAIVFTAGLGENSPETREAVLKGFEYLGLEIDTEKNKVRGKAVNFSKEGSKVQALVIPTNEELMIARDTQAIVKK